MFSPEIPRDDTRAKDRQSETERDFKRPSGRLMNAQRIYNQRMLGNSGGLSHRRVRLNTDSRPFIFRDKRNETPRYEDSRKEQSDEAERFPAFGSGEEKGNPLITDKPLKTGQQINLLPSFIL